MTGEPGWTTWVNRAEGSEQQAGAAHSPGEATLLGGSTHLGSRWTC